MKKGNYANSKNKFISDRNRERKEECVKNYYHKREKLWNDLINRIEKLENVSLSK